MFLGESTVEEREELAMERIRFALNDDKMSDSETVSVLLKGMYVINGEQGWKALRRFKEKQLQMMECDYRVAVGKVAKEIDDINQKLKRWRNG